MNAETERRIAALRYLIASNEARLAQNPNNVVASVYLKRDRAELAELLRTVEAA